MDPEKSNRPLFGTQGGGLVEEVSPGVYQFIEAPKDPLLALRVGDTMPGEWDIIPANEAARRLIIDEQFSNDDELNFPH